MTDMDTKILIGNTLVGHIAVDKTDDWHLTYDSR